ncbi:hypothetical protein COOONC_08335 [Cooperia oncophora]
MSKFHRSLYLLLPTLCTAAFPAIDSDLIKKAQTGEWILLNDDDDTMIKIVPSLKVFGKPGSFSFEEAERFCESDRGHLVSFRSHAEEEFIRGLRSCLINLISMKPPEFWLRPHPIPSILNNI